MLFRCARSSPAPASRHPTVTAWRWRYFDPRTGEHISYSEPLTTEQVLSINPRAEVIPGSRVVLSAGWLGTLRLLG